jgi:3-hydroxybutyryl-CoA dehydrogenase
MRTTIVGSGQMGHGIGLSYALGGHRVTLFDSDPAARDRAEAGIRAVAAYLVRERLVEEAAASAAIDRVSRSADLAAACAAADLVQEAVPEEMALKQALFAEVEPLVRADTIIATNTSSLRIHALGERMREPERLVGMHWVSPPYLVPIVEVVRGQATRDATVDRAVAILEGVGKIPIVVPDVPGFAVNRLQYALFCAAAEMVEDGIVTPEQVDLIVRNAMAPRQLAFGQFRMFDLIVSSRTVLAVAEYLHRETGDGRYRPTVQMQEMVDAGRLGLRSGGGWFDYPGGPAGHERRRDAAFAHAYRALAELDGMLEEDPGS